MTPERLKQIRRLFESVVDLTPEQRESILVLIRGKDPELVSEVEELVLAYNRRAGFIEQPATSIRVLDPLEEAESNRTGRVVGVYRLLELIGEGGMGEVWRAEQRTPVHRRVAVKLIKTGMDTREVVARFESERQALAMMDHPAIAKVYDAASTPEGRPYFAMEYVAGVPITNYCDEHRLTTRERLELFVRVCDGVQHAHQKAIIHRDLKPSNILVTEVDGKPAPKIIDFGVARAISHRLTEETVFTRIGAVLGTLSYMSPEQAYSAGEDLDTRTDVYSLGVILYEILVGALPFDFGKVPFGEILRRLREDDAPYPSTKLRTTDKQTTASQNRRTEPTALLRQLRGDLDAITLKALEKDRVRRYGTPLELAADIGRFLRSDPVLARPASIRYQMQKYVRRHPAGVAAVSTLILLLASFGILEAIQLRRITRERDRADRIAKFMTAMFQVSNPSESRGNKVTAREILDKASADIGVGLANDPELQADMMDVMGTVYDNLGLYPQAESLTARTLQIRRRLFGLEHPKTAQSMTNLARTLFREGHYPEAEKLNSEALAIQRRVLGANHPNTLRAMQNLATIYRREGKTEEAEGLERTVLAVRRQVLGPEDPETLMSMGSLSGTLDEEHRYAEAEKLASQVLETRRRVLGPEHPDTLRAIHQLANIFYDQGRYDETANLDRETLEIRKRVLGPEHPDTLTAMVALADSLDVAGKVSDAEALERQARDMQVRLLGPEHPDTLLTTINFARILGEQGKFQEGETLLRQAAAARAKLLGTENPQTLETVSRLASLLIKSGQLEEAERLSTEVRERQRRLVGERHPDTAGSTYNLACIASVKGRPDDALSLLREAVDHGLSTRTALNIQNDQSFKPLYGDARFIALASDARQRTLSARRSR